MRPTFWRLLTIVVPVWLTLGCAESGYAQAVNYDRISKDAETLFRQHHYAGAAALLEKGLATATSENRRDWEAMMLGLLGPVYQCEGKYSQAEDVLNQSIDSWTRLLGPNAPTLTGPLGNLGELYASAGQPSRAEKLLTRAHSIANHYSYKPGAEARMLINLGNVYFDEHKDDLAEQAADQVLAKVAQMKAETPDTVPVYSLLAAICFRAGRLDEAEIWLKKSLSARESTLPADDPLIAESLGNLAAFYSHSDRPEEARPLFEKAAKIFEVSGGDNRFRRNFYRVYAEFERSSGHRKEARELAKRADQLWNISSAKELSRQIVDVSVLQQSK